MYTYYLNAMDAIYKVCCLASTLWSDIDPN